MVCFIVGSVWASTLGTEEQLLGTAEGGDKDLRSCLNTATSCLALL